MPTKQLLDVSKNAVKAAMKKGADQVQVAAFLLDIALTRFANSQIHQNVASKTGGLAVKVIVKKKIGTLLANTLDKEKIEDVIEKVIKIARVAPPNRDFRSLPKAEKWSPIKGAFDPKTATCTPEFRAERVMDIIQTVHSKSKHVKAVAGSYSTGASSFAISNSLGVSAYAQVSLASVGVTVISEAAGSQGFGSDEQHSRFVKALDHIKVAGEAVDKSLKA